MTAAQFKEEMYKVNTLFNFMPEVIQNRWIDAFEIFWFLNFDEKKEFNFDDFFKYFDTIEMFYKMLPSLN